MKAEELALCSSSLAAGRSGFGMSTTLQGHEGTQEVDESGADSRHMFYYYSYIIIIIIIVIIIIYSFKASAVALKPVAMGGRMSIGQVRPKRRRLRGGGSEDFIAPGFDEDDLLPVNPSARLTLQEGLYLNRGAKHGQGKRELSSLPEDFTLPGIPEYELEEGKVQIKR